MTKILTETKLQAINEWLSHQNSINAIAKKYGIEKSKLRIMLAAYQHHGPKIFTNPPKITAEFRIRVARWMVQNHASYSQTAAHFGYLGVAQMYQWRKVYLQRGSDGLRSLQKGRPSMTKPKQSKTQSDQEKIAELEERIQELEVKNALLKELASMKRNGLLK